MPATLRIPATLAAATPEPEGARCGLTLRFEPQLLRHGPAPLHDFIDLTPPLSLGSARGLSQLTRLLRAARLAARGPVERWLGDAAGARAAIAAALGKRLVLSVAPRSCVRFTAWTEEGVHEIDWVADVLADEAGFFIRRVGVLPAAHFSRETLLRHETSTQQWLEVCNIEPAVVVARKPFVAARRSTPRSAALGAGRVKPPRGDGSGSGVPRR